MADAEIDAEQAAIYDRQLRVWGVEAQRRISSSRVLFIGLSGLMAEAAKNVVLAGCGAVDIIEPKSPVPDDPAPLGNFLALAGARDAGASHAEACAASLRDMNPFVESSGSKRELSSVAEDEISRYTIVVCVGQPMPVVRDLDAKCSRIGVKFIAASAPGPVGWYFLNLQRHDYVTETRTHDTEERVVKQNTFEYVDLATALRTPLGAKMRGAGMDLLGLVRALDRLEGKLGRRAGAGDMEVAMEVAREEERAEGAEEGRISREVLREYLGGEHEVPGLAAVLGGVLGNDIIAAVSGKGAPSNNIVGLSMSGGLVVREMRAGQ